MATGINPIPEGYHSLTPHLINENASRLIEFLKQAFDAQEHNRLSGPDGRVLHAEIQIGDSRLMIGEATDEWRAMPAALVLYVDDADAVYKRALDAGAMSLREPADQFYGDRSAGVKDLAGNHWWIATHIEDVPRGELRLRAERLMKASTKLAV